MGSIGQFLKTIHDKDIELNRKVFSGTPFHCGFWASVSLRSAIAKSADHVNGCMLDAGCGLKTHKAFFSDNVKRYIGLDYSPTSGYLGNKADIYGDIKRLPFMDNSFDTILCSEVLEHIDRTDVAMGEFHRVLKIAGIIIITAPFMYPVHSCGADFMRFTRQGLVSILERNNFKVLDVKPLSGSAKTLAMLLNIHLVEECFLWNKFLYPISILIRPLIWIMAFLINIAGAIPDSIIRIDSAMPFGHLIIAKTEEKR